MVRRDSNTLPRKSINVFLKMTKRVNKTVQGTKKTMKDTKTKKGIIQETRTEKTTRIKKGKRIKQTQKITAGIRTIHSMITGNGFRQTETMNLKSRKTLMQPF